MAVAPQERVTVTFRNAYLVYKNFAGAKKQFNNQGDRNFCILLDESQVLDLQRDKNRWGDTWNIKPYKPRQVEEGDAQLYQLKVSVKFDVRPPSCWLVSNGGQARLKLPEDAVEILDRLQSSRIDLTIVAFDWEVNGNTGRKAYLEAIYFHMYENPLDVEYRDVPELGSVDMSKQLEIEASGQTPPQDYIDTESELVESHY